MRVDTSNPPLVRGNLLPQSLLAEAVARRARHVTELLLTRRRIALAYQRVPSDEQGLALQRLDTELAKYNIDIPTIQRLRNRRQEAPPAMPAQTPRTVSPDRSAVL